MISTITSSAQDIFDVSRSGDIDSLEKIYDLNKDAINAVDNKGFTPLILSAYNNQKEVVAYLLEKRSNVNAQDASGNTALMGVCFKGNFEIAKMLIDHYASTFGHTEIADYLLKNKADASIMDNRGNTALQHAQMQGNTEVIALLK